MFSGVGKTAEELAFAVEQGIYQINVETEGELDVLSAVAHARGKRQVIALRVNRILERGGMPRLPLARLPTSSASASMRQSGSMPRRRICGPASAGRGGAYRQPDFRTHRFARGVREDAQPCGAYPRGWVAIERLDLGGGVGVPYEITYPYEEGPSRVDAYAAMVAEVTKGLDVELGFEPGRLIVGNAGVMLTRALYINERPEKRFLVVDAAMNDLVRPAMYDAHHEIWPVNELERSAPKAPFDVVGPFAKAATASLPTACCPR